MEHSRKLSTLYSITEPAKLLPIGNCILEFAPSGAYVEDWRQQSSSGLFCGLRLLQAEHIATQQKFAMDGGLIIAGEHLAYAQSRLPLIQKQFENISDLNDAIENKKIRASFVESYQVSIALNGPTIQFSTQSHLVNKVLQLDNFEIDSVGNITQLTEIEGETYRLYFSSTSITLIFSLIDRLQLPHVRNNGCKKKALIC